MFITVDDFLPFDLLRREAGQDVVADQALPVLRVFVTLHLSALVVFALDVGGSHRTLDLHPADGRHIHTSNPVTSLEQQDAVSVRQSENVRAPEGVVVFLLQLLHVGGTEVKLSAGRTADGVLVVTGLRTFARSGLQAERRQVCGAARRK